MEESTKNRLKQSIFLGLFIWFMIGVITKNIAISLLIGIISTTLISITLKQIPIIKKRRELKKIEADLPFFLIELSTELQIGKNFQRAIIDASKNDSPAGVQFRRIVESMQKGASFSEALIKFNDNWNSSTIRRVTSNLSNLSSIGTKDTSGIKKNC